MATYLTQEGFDKKMEELSALEAQRPAIKQAIAEARDKGDLSENAEYDAAKEAVFAVTRAAFLAGWLAAGGDAPQEERLFQVLPGGAPET